MYTPWTTDRGGRGCYPRGCATRVRGGSSSAVAFITGCVYLIHCLPAVELTQQFHGFENRIPDASTPLKQKSRGQHGTKGLLVPLIPLCRCPVAPQLLSGLLSRRANRRRRYCLFDSSFIHQFPPRSPLHSLHAFCCLQGSSLAAGDPSSPSFPCPCIF